MEEYLVPTQPAETEFTEKRSRFLGCVYPISSEEEARALLEAVRKKHHDARHHCWCYRLRQGGIERYSDDGEPQGTAGQPMLAVFQREQVTNVLCVVTRYFGGILLGAGGLTRAYGRSAKDALTAAGISVNRLWSRVEIPCPYPLLERVKRLVEQRGGLVSDAAYGQDVRLQAAFPAGGVEPFLGALTELSNGTVSGTVTGQEFRAAPLDGDGPDL